MGAQPAAVGFPPNQQAVIVKRPTCAYDQMTDLGIADDAIGKADRATRGGQQRHRVSRGQVVEYRRVRGGDRISWPGRGVSPAIDNEQDPSAHGRDPVGWRASSLLQNAGNDLATQPGLRMTTPALRSPAMAKLIAMRWSS